MVIIKDRVRPDTYGAREFVDGLTLADVPQLVESTDPVARCQAQVLLRLASQDVRLPNQTWCVYATYRDGWGGPGRKAIWSAHFSKAEALRWLPHWVIWAKRRERSDYEMKIGRLDDVPPHYLRDSDADPAECVR